MIALCSSFNILIRYLEMLSNSTLVVDKIDISEASEIANLSPSPSSILPYCAVYPPSIIILCPVMKEVASEHNQTTVFAISSGLAIRPIGCAAGS